MAENIPLHLQTAQLDTTYRELLVNLKNNVTQLASQIDAISCAKWIQKLQSLIEPDDIKLRNYLLLQICNQIRTGYLGHPFINLGYLNQDLNVVANCCREWETMCNDADELFQSKRTVSNITNVATESYTSDVDGEVVRSMALQKIFRNPKVNWFESKKRFAKPFEIGQQRQNFYQRKYEKTLEDLKEAKLKLYLKNTRSFEEFVDYLGENFIENYQNSIDELLSIEKSSNSRTDFVSFQLNFCNKFKLMCGELLNTSIAENLLRTEEQFQRTFHRILCKFVENNENSKDHVSTDRDTVSTDLNAPNTKYSDYLKRYIRKQQKQFNRKVQDYEGQIAALKNDLRLHDKKQSRQIIEMKCENIMRSEQKTRDQLSESINELESKYKAIVQQIFNDIQQT